MSQDERQPQNEPGKPNDQEASEREAVGSRRPEAAGKVLIAILICLGLWSLVASSTLRASAEASPFGARRSAALAVLTPISDLSRLLGLARLNSMAETSLGRPDPLAPPPTIPNIKPLKHHSGPTVVPPLRRATRGDPIRVLVLGDSTALDLGYGLQRAATATGKYKVALDGRISTGLARLDYFNWLAQAQKDMVRYHPDVVVVMLGLNDLQDFQVGNSYVIRYTPRWIRAYSRRVGDMLAEVSSPNRRVVWIGEPIVSNKNIAYGLQIVNHVYRKQTAGIPGVYYLDTWHLFVDGRGRYTAYLHDSSGHLQQVREADGEHLTPAGQDRVGRYAFAFIGSLSNPSGQTPAPSPSSARTHASS